MTKPHLYRKHFTPAECCALKAIPENDVASEVNFLRIMLVRFLGSHGKSDLKSQLDALRAAGDSASMIASLVRTQIKAHNPGTELSRAMEEALDELRKELNI